MYHLKIPFIIVSTIMINIIMKEAVSVCLRIRYSAFANIALCYRIYISNRVTGLYRLGKTCYLHSLLCNNSIIAQFPAQNDIISICTWENDNTANSHAYLKHVNGDVPLFAQKSCHGDATWQNSCGSIGTPTWCATVVILPMNWLVDCARTISTW